MKKQLSILATAALAAMALGTCFGGIAQAQPGSGIDQIDTVVVIYAENRSFDSLYGAFPGANGLQHVTSDMYLQRDRDGSVLNELPPVWTGLTAIGLTPPVTEAETQHLPNKPFAIDDPKGFNQSLGTITRDLWHLFYQNQMQIDGGKNDKFVAFADSGALVMGHYQSGGQHLPLWNVARHYALADNFFQGAFGGSFLNHFQLICACVPIYPNADQGVEKSKIAAVDADGVSLTLAADSPKSAIDGPPKFVNNGSITPKGVGPFAQQDFYAINTMQPPFQPSTVKPAKGGDPRYADPDDPTVLPPQAMQNIGDLLSAKGITWAWYAGAWQAALDNQNGFAAPDFQYHHQPFNYFADMAPGNHARAEHLRDGGLDGAKFIAAIDSGTLPTVTFYKPQGSLNEHPGYTNTLSGDAHIADVVAHLEKSKQWPHMLVVITWDENGGQWDHVAPPKADRFGPGSRIPAIIVSPLAKRGIVDHTQYDTTSILRFITARFQLPVLPGIAARDAALVANGNKPMGDLTAALNLTAR
ncbi:MAG TPA: acid phosphatase [Stellaceae bacterium]|jgi:phospholipase C|nr:acid phosphatase [Stellaceae bacterium]